MNVQEKFLLEQSHAELASTYDESVGLLGKGRPVHGVRASANFALSILMTGGDVKEAEKVIRAVISTQYTKPGTIYYGTYKRNLEEVDPPLDAVVWDDYDPNWREFMSTVFAMILENYKDKLSAETIKIMEDSTFMAVTGSIARYYMQITSMNTNIDLMGIFISEYYGRYFSDPKITGHSINAATNFLNEFKKTDTVAEYNSVTYYGVDFFALALMIKYSTTKEVHDMAVYVLDKMWDSVSNLYNATLENVCGPYSRSYEMEMLEHSSFGSIIYKCLEDENYKHLAKPNCETFADSLLVISGLTMPEKYRDRFTKPCGEKEVSSQFNELCERHPLYNRNFLCDCTSYLKDDLMIGAMSGSQNTSGQLCPGTIFWKYEGELYWIRVSRRLPGGRWADHFEGIKFNGTAKKDYFHMEADLKGETKEVFLELHGKDIHTSTFDKDKWVMPGLTLDVEISKDFKIRKTADNRVEIYMEYKGTDEEVITIDFKGFYQN